MLPDFARIGLVEDDPIMGESIVQRLELEGWNVTWWRSGNEAIAAIETHPLALDLVVCDILLPDVSGEAVFQSLSKLSGTPPFLFITGYGEIDQAVRLMRYGAVDFMTKPFVMDDFLKRIGSGCRAQHSAAEPTALGISAAMQNVASILSRYAANDLPVLITGETGVGKEVAARFLHNVSSHANEPFMAVNCAAIPADLMESELFGHEKGAFTGATQRHLGYAERAGKGTLFLDEIGDMSAALQSKLLRLIEQKAFTRVGGEATVHFNARIVSATHRTLNAKPSENHFRDDLYFRISVLPVEIPPLRERADDIIGLMDHFLDEATQRTDTDIRGFSSLAEDAAISHPWPGNVRELRNRVERAAALARGEWIMPADLFPEGGDAKTPTGFTPLADVRDAAEKRQIERALDQTGGQISKAASLLAISRTTLWEKMARFGMVPKER
ncbi:MAG: sigma-54 dependent transcriptional regulator [Phyllobacterium sp.]|uniref:sigma-54-dependent transcriptional regulator n=1 Tax=Phyllobacterium sp. TaxID=1871046 RepID=UPI0030F186CA